MEYKNRKMEEIKKGSTKLYNKNKILYNGCKLIFVSFSFVIY